MNDWLILLLAFRNQKFPQYDYGLTPRFIVGACQIPIGKKFENATEAYDVTKEIFLEMKEYNHDGLVVTSNQCDDHNGPVMQLVDTKWTDKTIGTSFSEVWDRYGDEIILGEYHISNKELRIIETIFDV